MLTTVYRPDANTQVFEAEIGAPLRTLLSSGAETQAWLVGGYHGTWLPMPQAAGLTLANDTLKSSRRRSARACSWRCRPTGAA